MSGCAQPGQRPTRQATQPGTQTEPTSPGHTPQLPGDITVELTPVTEQPRFPTAFSTTPTGKHYVGDRPGMVYFLDETAELVLDISDKVVTQREQGLIGMTIHPAYEQNRLVYIRYSTPPRPSTPESYSHTFILSEFRADDDGALNPDSERIILEIPQPQGNHNSGSLAFGPDGYLYVGVGDGGGSGDTGEGHVEDWYAVNPGGNGQDITQNLLGGVLRIDVDTTSGDKPYGIPEDNPLVGDEGLDEYYAWGLRNPWGISFDDGTLYLADVGESQFEEVNIIESGGNYGWNIKEGTHCYLAQSCPNSTPRGEQLRDPIIEYSHSDADVSGNAVIGGHVYRGDAIPDLSGQYIFGDLHAAGRLFVATPRANGLWPTHVLRVAEPSNEILERLITVGKDHIGELYTLTNHGVHRLGPAEAGR